MTPQRRVLALWTVIGALLALCTALLWGPMRIAWHCTWLHDNAPREQARVMAKLDDATFGLLIEQGPHAGGACTADTSFEIFDATEQGDLLEVVHIDWKPGTCELVSTIEASARLLWLFSGSLAFIALGLIALGVVLHRSFTRPGHPPRRLAASVREVRCPSCGKQMDEGYVPLLAGISWRRIGEPVGLPHALRGLPGTVGMRGRPRLHALRCVPCEVLTLQYGDPPRR